MEEVGLLSVVSRNSSRWWTPLLIRINLFSQVDDGTVEHKTAEFWQPPVSVHQQLPGGCKDVNPVTGSDCTEFRALSKRNRGTAVPYSSSRKYSGGGRWYSES